MPGRPRRSRRCREDRSGSGRRSSSVGGLPAGQAGGGELAGGEYPGDDERRHPHVFADVGHGQPVLGEVDPDALHGGRVPSAVGDGERPATRCPLPDARRPTPARSRILARGTTETENGKRKTENGKRETGNGKRRVPNS